MRISYIFPIVFSATLIGAEYIIPPEYDNTVMATKSHHEVLITNLTSILSASTYNIGGANYRYKCVSVPKVQCRNGQTPTITLSLKEIPILKDPLKQQSVPIYEVNTEWEDAGSNFRVCGAALGVVEWDTSTLTQDAATGEITYAYTPIDNTLAYYFFTDATGNATTTDVNGKTYDGGAKIGSNNSYMVIESQQTCY